MKSDINKTPAENIDLIEFAFENRTYTFTAKPHDGYREPLKTIAASFSCVPPICLEKPSPISHRISDYARSPVEPIQFQ